MKNSGFIFSLMLAAATLTAVPVWAVETVSPSQDHPPTAIDRYLAKTDAQFDRGMTNFTGGWTEILRQPAAAYQQKDHGNAFWRVTKGTGKGLALGLTDVLGGFTNAVTSVVPYFEIPLIDGGFKTSNLTGGDPEKAKDDFEKSIDARTRREQKKPLQSKSE